MDTGADTGTFTDTHQSETSTEGADAGGWTTVRSRRGGRKNGFGRRGLHKDKEEDVLFPLQPRRDLSGGIRRQRY